MSAENSLRIKENLHVMKPPVNESEWYDSTVITIQHDRECWFVAAAETTDYCAKI